MSVVLYNASNPHPAGFHGYRVAVMVDGTHKQRYFSINRAPKTEQFNNAHKTNAAWLKQKERVQTHRDNQAIQTIRSQYGTGVKGIAIKICYSPDKKGNSKAYKHKKYVVQGQHNGKGFSRSFPITDTGWENAVTYLAKSKELTRWKHLLTRKPL